MDKFTEFPGNVVTEHFPSFYHEDDRYFAIFKEEQPIGQLLLGMARMETAWHYYASYLDEFIQRGLVESEDDFKAAYKDPDEFCCLFVVDKEFTNFVFIPYPED